MVYQNLKLAELTEKEYTLLMDGLGLDAATCVDPTNGIGYVAIRASSGAIDVYRVVDWPHSEADDEVWFRFTIP